MRTNLLVAVVCLALVGGGMAFASEVGNNPEGTGWRLDVGYERSATDVELKDPAIVYGYYDEYMDEYPDYYWTYSETMTIDSFNGRETLDKYFLKAAYGFGERYSVYFRIGMARMNSEHYDPITTYAEDYYEYGEGEWIENYYDTWLSAPIQGVGDWDPFYGVGFKAVFHHVGDFKVGVDVQYNQYKLDADYYQYLESWGGIYGPAGAPYDVWDYVDSHQIMETDTTEYQAALVFSKKNERFSPYGGLKISQLETDYSGHSYYSDYYDRQPEYEESWDWTYTTQSTDNFGLFLGADYEMTGNFSLSGEIQVGDQNATAVKLTWKF